MGGEAGMAAGLATAKAGASEREMAAEICAALIRAGSDLPGPGVLSFDGERDRVLAAGTVAHVVIRRDGPFVIDPRRAIAAAGARRSFDRPNLDRN